ncbi:MAG: hypothetical protein IKR73_04135 [Oscillospiraceae bacterium]|nr:hypothetical protein [Oscillospiraceae bacterium]
MKARTRVALVVISVICALWAILPDPVPVAIDDIIAGLGSVISVLTVASSFIKKNDTQAFIDNSDDNTEE